MVFLLWDMFLPFGFSLCLVPAQAGTTTRSQRDFVSCCNQTPYVANGNNGKGDVSSTQWPNLCNV